MVYDNRIWWTSTHILGVFSPRQPSLAKSDNTWTLFVCKLSDVYIRQISCAIDTIRRILQNYPYVRSVVGGHRDITRVAAVVAAVWGGTTVRLWWSCYWRRHCRARLCLVLKSCIALVFLRPWCRQLTPNTDQHDHWRKKFVCFRARNHVVYQCCNWHDVFGAQIVK